MSTFLHQQFFFFFWKLSAVEKGCLNETYWTEVHLENWLFKREPRPNHSGPVPLAPLSRSAARYLSDFEPRDYPVILHLFKVCVPYYFNENITKTPYALLRNWKWRQLKRHRGKSGICTLLPIPIKILTIYCRNVFNSTGCWCLIKIHKRRKHCCNI